MVGSPSGKVADCNSALASSTLAPTSNAVQLGSFIEVVVSKSLRSRQASLWWLQWVDVVAELVLHNREGLRCSLCAHKNRCRFESCLHHETLK